MAQAESGAAQDVSLNEFLAGIKMQQHGTLLEELGYDDVGDFGQYSDVDLERMRAALTSNSMPAGHIDKFVRAIVKQRPPAAPPAAAAALVPSPAPLPCNPGHCGMASFRSYGLGPCASIRHQSLLVRTTARTG